MPRPRETIPVKYTEDMAQYAEVRPVVNQPMTLEELVGLVLATTGKRPERVRMVLKRGSCGYNIYRYWWGGFEIDDATLEDVLARYPDPEPARAFDPGRCLWVELVDAQEPRPRSVLIEAAEAARRRWFRKESFWDFLVNLARRKPPAYQDYSYYHRADLYRVELSTDERDLLLRAIGRLAARPVQRQLLRGSRWATLQFACRR